MRYRALILGFLAFLINATTVRGESSADQLLFLYEEYPPYTYTEDGQVVGSVADQARAITSKAGLDIIWQKATYGRMLRSIANSEGMAPVCIAGYGSSSRKSPATWMSEPFSMSPEPGIAVHQQSLPKFSGHDSIEDILSDPTISGAFLQGANYGEGLGKLIEAGKPRHLFIGGEDNDLALMVARGRVDFAMVNPDQVAYLRDSLPGGNVLVVLTPSGLRVPEPDYILCSSGLPEAFRERLNAAIREFVAR